MADDMEFSNYTKGVDGKDSNYMELYNITKDRTENYYIADRFSEEVAELKTGWIEWAKEFNVFPLYRGGKKIILLNNR